MAKTFSTVLLLATAALEVAGQAGGWYVVNESLTCTSTCDIMQSCNIVGAPSDDDIAGFCKQITDDCADGALSQGQRFYLFGIPSNGNLGTNNFETGNNNGCPNNDDCQQSFKYLAANMRHPSAAGFPDTNCRGAYIDVKSYATNEVIGAIIVGLPSVQTKGP